MMAKKQSLISSKTLIQSKIEWNVPPDLVARYATNLVVQRMENEYLISFFEIKPPILLGEKDEVIRMAKEMKYITANCVAQVIVAADKMPGFVEALSKNLKDISEEPTGNEAEE